MELVDTPFTIGFEDMVPVKEDTFIHLVPQTFFIVFDCKSVLTLLIPGTPLIKAPTIFGYL